MDKVKRFWQLVVKEREDFWDSFFKKYEDEQQPLSDFDARSYMDNSSSRIDALLKIASENDDTAEGLIDKFSSSVEKYFEGPKNNELCVSEQEVSSLVSSSVQDNLNQSDSSTKISSSPHKAKIKLPPVFIMEITTEDDEIPNFNKTLPLKKFKLFDSPKTVHNCCSEEFMDKPSSLLSETFADDELEINIVAPAAASFLDESTNSLCRRVRPRSKNFSAPKRFKLA